MPALLADTSGLASTRWRKLFARWLRDCPEWWVLALCAAAWLWLLSQPGMPWLDDICRVDAGGTNLVRALQGSIDDAMLPMTAAMMLPLAAGPARYASLRSLWRRRHLAIFLVLCGYLGLWLAAAPPLHALSAFIGLMAGDPSIAMAVAVAAAALWQSSPVKSAALAACHRGRALAPAGAAANRDCLIYGAQSGIACLRSCWLLMLPPLASGHSPTVMIGIAALAAAERYRGLPTTISSALLLGLLFAWRIWG
ncbi:DUF2182 domain-containing protein [Chromobacterium phragmitis]|uniref:DUF2182 domain-containing protein n=1 Tax=Chromobacterium phragmitis TaxID=2202141 RepID=A0A344UFC6_9NEIS|nr:DUF2182 domain-containing protein [Chromobacterium phragmitis]AXE33974.1 hypothetical protein DK843_06470 [Chromobacterium phragmitis]